MSEDCLTLNVVAPTELPAHPLPVVFFIHGGGYAFGSSATSIYDGATLRTSPLATLYARGRVRHASGLAALEDALRSHTDEKPSPIVEALVAAVSRLVACYPWLGAGGEPEAMRGPRAAEGMHEGGERPEALTRRLGAR